MGRQHWPKSKIGRQRDRLESMGRQNRLKEGVKERLIKSQLLYWLPIKESVEKLGRG